ncbi:MAG: hypothetical protein J0H15_00895 [Xanthomonadales bacterium]|nr:hypothetical protein [Xanthomonadales bacterium]
MSTEPASIQPAAEFSFNLGRFSPPPRTVARASCGVCGAAMEVRQNAVGPTCLAAALGRIHRAFDSFTCPRREEHWHEKAVELVHSVGKQPSRALRWLAGEELDRLLHDNGVTPRHRALVHQHLVQPISG